MSHLEGEVDQAAGILQEVSLPPPEEQVSELTAEEPIAPETGTGVAVTVGQLQQQVCRLEDENQSLQSQLNQLRVDVSQLAREEFDRLLAEVIEQEAEEMATEDSVEPAAAPKRRHSSWWSG